MRTVQHRSRYKAPGQSEAGDGQSVKPTQNDGPNSDLPSSEPTLFPPPGRWVPQRKAEVVDAVRCGFISLDEACKRYALSIEEFLAWQHRIDLFGLAGLRVYGIQTRNGETAPVESGQKSRVRRKARQRPAKSAG